MSTEARPKEHRSVGVVSRAVYDRAEKIAGELIAGRDEVRVLDVGCGSQSSIQIPGTTYLIGIDVDEKGLKANPSLDERLLIGVEDMDFPNESFDGVVSHYSLEHVAEPDVAIGKMVRVLKLGGVLILVVPNVRSAKALIAKITPTRFHVWAYRNLAGRKQITTEGEHGGPFPTVLDASLREAQLTRLLRTLGLEVRNIEKFEDPNQREFRERIGLTGGKWDAVRSGTAKVFGEEHVPGNSEFIIVAQRVA